MCTFWTGSFPRSLGERRHDLSAMISAPASPGASSEVPVTVEPDRNVTSQRIWARSSRASAVPMRDPSSNTPTTRRPAMTGTRATW